MTQPNRGFILVNKPEGITSFDAIRSLRRKTGIRQIGHSGTLDPLATGLLICALGPYTRLCRYIEACDKSYIATIKFGEKTDTGDREGKVTGKSASIPEHIDVEAVTREVLALTELEVPAYSAVKIQGKPAYALARQGVSLKLAKRPTHISCFKILEYRAPFLSFGCTVSKGTYIRSLGEFIASVAGSVAHTVSLCRTAIGGVALEEAIALDDVSPDNWSGALYPAVKLLANYEAYLPSEDELAMLRNGRSVVMAGPDNSEIMLFGSDGVVRGVAQRQSDILAPKINLKQ